ncbi:MAG: hypothetical protein IBX70_13645 [Clostridia bacterium]|nr:hypothetical protein [Clostridia bacterium]
MGLGQEKIKGKNAAAGVVKTRAATRRSSNTLLDILYESISSVKASQEWQRK